jgi:NUMOD3 motif
MPAPKDPVKREEWIRKNRESHIGKRKGIPMNDEIKEKIRKSNTGGPKSEEAKKNMSNSMKGRIPWNAGIPHTEETKEKMRLKKIGIPLSEEHKKKIGISNKGNVPNITPESIEKNRIAHLGKEASDITKQKMSASHKGQQTFKGMTHSPESKKLMSIAHKGKPKSEETRKNMSGQRNNRWRGGVTPFLKSVRELPEMYKWKSDIMKRDDYRDCFTGDRGNHDLEVHHIIPMSIILIRNNIDTIEDAINCKALWDLNNGVTMFKESHLKHHNKYGMSILPKEYYFRTEILF